jgi:hypothetical protein
MRASAVQDQGGAPASQAQAPATASPASKPENSPSPAKPAPRKHRKKTGVPDCVDASTPAKQAANPAATSDPGSAKTAGDSSQPSTTATKPCPPPIKVIKNGGSDEPTVQLQGNTTAAQASQERATTEQLTAATQENLKKIAGVPLSPSQKDMVNQIKDFLEESKKAVASGDLERGRNLAVKARLLSDELGKP